MENDLRRWMRLVEDNLLEAVPTSPAFRKWFKGSKVVDKNGQPLRCFHGTKVDFLPPFKAFTHFGTADAAEQRIYGRYGVEGQWQADTAHFQNARVFPVFLRICKPYSYPDRPTDSYAPILKKMLKDNLIDQKAFDALDPFDATTCAAFIIKTLTAKGFDGLTYINKKEDVGSRAWVVFQPEQVWPEFE